MESLPVAQIRQGLEPGSPGTSARGQLTAFTSALNQASGGLRTKPGLLPRKRIVISQQSGPGAAAVREPGQAILGLGDSVVAQSTKHHILTNN